MNYLVEHAKESGAVGLSMDGWSAKTTQKYMGVLLSWITPDLQMRTAAVAHYKDTDSSGEEIWETVDGYVRKWGIGDVLQGITTDNARPIRLASRRLGREYGATSVTCYCHVLDLVMGAGEPAMKKLHFYARKLAAHFKQSNVATDTLLRLQRNAAAASHQPSIDDAVAVEEELAFETRTPRRSVRFVGALSHYFAMASDEGESSDSEESESGGGVAASAADGPRVADGVGAVEGCRRGRPRPKKVRQDVVTRFSSLLLCLRSIKDLWYALSRFLSNDIGMKGYRNKHPVFTNALLWWRANFDKAVEPIMELMEVIDSASRALSSEKKPAYPRVMEQLSRLRQALAPSDTDGHGAYSKVKKLMLSKFEVLIDGKDSPMRYFNVPASACSASLLDPKLFPCAKRKPCLTREEIKTIKREGLDDIFARYGGEPTAPADAVGASSMEAGTTSMLQSLLGDPAVGVGSDTVGCDSDRARARVEQSVDNLHQAFNWCVFDHCQEQALAYLAEFKEMMPPARVKAVHDAFVDNPLVVYE